VNADQKHEQHDAELAERIQRVEAGSREQGLRRPRRDATEQRRSQHQSRDHLADHARLSQPAKQ
jgi:hypothetical protein